MPHRLVAGALALVAGGLVSGCGFDCKDFTLRSAEFKRDLKRIEFSRQTPAEQRLRAAAFGLVKCGRLRGRTPEQVRQLLGPPTSNEIDDNPRPHRGYSYVVGYTTGRGSDDEDKLTMEFDRGRVVYAAAPGRKRGGPGGGPGGYKEVESGRLVGGGPRPDPAPTP